jgi:hypothetical protein
VPPAPWRRRKRRFVGCCHVDQAVVSSAAVGLRVKKASLYYDTIFLIFPDPQIAAGKLSSVRHITDPGGLLRQFGGLSRQFEKSCLSHRTAGQSTPTNLARRPLSATQAASDDVLIARIAQGDRLAMQVLYGRHHVRVFRFGLRLVRDEQVAEDLISEVFLDVWRQAGKFEGRSAVSTWLLAITRFKALSALRRRKDVELDDEAANAIEDPTIPKSRCRRRIPVERCASA